MNLTLEEEVSLFDGWEGEVAGNVQPLRKNGTDSANYQSGALQP